MEDSALAVASPGRLPGQPPPAEIAKNGQQNSNDDDNPKPGSHLNLLFSLASTDAAVSYPCCIGTKPRPRWPLSTKSARHGRAMFDSRSAGYNEDTRSLLPPLHSS